MSNSPMTFGYQSSSNKKLTQQQDEEFIVGSEEEKSMEKEDLLIEQIICVKEVTALNVEEQELTENIGKALSNQEKYDIRSLIRNAE